MKTNKGRVSILSAVIENQPSLVPLPALDYNQWRLKDHTQIIDDFVKNVQEAGSSIKRVKDYAEAEEKIIKNFKGQIVNLSFHISVPSRISDYSIESLKDIGTVIIRPRLGVAENGALWLSDDDFSPRPIIFICEQLIAIIKSEEIVATLHDAYAAIEPLDYGYGVFIGGPSKTADIEQSLVLGAHGPKLMHVFLVG